MAGPIIVGVDGSDTAAQAARVAGELARGLGVAVHCVSAYDKDASFAVAEGSDQWDVTSRDRAQELANHAAIGQVGGGVEVTHAGVVGKPAEVLVHEAERLDASMIVVGNRRMQGLGRLLGSVASSVAHGAPCDATGGSARPRDRRVAAAKVGAGGPARELTFGKGPAASTEMAAPSSRHPSRGTPALSDR